MISENVEREYNRLKGMPAEAFSLAFSKISNKMHAEYAKDLSDNEIVRTLEGCVCPYFCMAIAVIARERGMGLGTEVAQ